MNTTTNNTAAANLFAYDVVRLAGSHVSFEPYLAAYFDRAEDKHEATHPDAIAAWAFNLEADCREHLALTTLRPTHEDTACLNGSRDVLAWAIREGLALEAAA